MPTSPYFPTYYSGHSGEQGLAQDLVDEQIKLFGTDIYYLPRTLLQDNTLEEVRYSKYQEQFQIEMLLQNVSGFGDNSEFVSKFGLRITDEVVFRVSTRRWDQVVAAEQPTLTYDGRPNEGDLLYFPLTEDIYEIKFVEKESPFFQFGKIQFYTLTAELYELGSDSFDTGVTEIDDVEQLFDPAIKLFMDPGGSGDFQVGEEVVGDQFLATAVAVTIPTRKVIVGSKFNDDNGTSSGSVYVYNFDGTDELKITPSDGAAGDNFGHSVAGDGLHIVVGARGDDTSRGSAYIYNYDGTNEIKLTPSDGFDYDYFGSSVSIGHGKVVIGSRGDDDNGSSSGSAYIYDVDGTNEIKITASDATQNDYYGDKVAIGNNKIGVGAWHTNNERGAVYVYDLDGTNEVKITASDGVADSNFGRAFAIGDNKIAVGSPESDNPTNSGAVYVYNLDGTGEVKITASDASSYDNFGASVAVGDGKVIVGSIFDDDNGTSSGSVYVYNLDGTGEVKITASDGETSDYFGRSVAVKDGKIIVGAYAADTSSPNVGATYIYDLDGTNELKILASDRTNDDQFGWSVAALSDSSTVTLTGITLTDGGEHYKAALPPAVTITGGGGNGATATATVSSVGIVTGITLTNAGNGYSSTPTVTIDYSPKDSRAEVKSWNSSTRELQVINRTGTFNTSETVKGLTSGALWSPETFDTLNNTSTTSYSQNREIEDSGDEIIDWTEGNPFGEYGNFTDSI